MTPHDLQINRHVDIYKDTKPFICENGSRLEQIDIGYETYGKLNTQRNNAVLVCHALTGNANAAGSDHYPESLTRTHPFMKALTGSMDGWWKTLIGPGKTIDTDKYYVICSNVLGSCYGSSGPSSINPQTGKTFAIKFPQVTVRDMVHAQKRLLEHLGVGKLAVAIGGSLGGMQVLEWAVTYPEVLQTAIIVATSARHSDWSIGLNHLARQAIKDDPVWNGGFYEQQPHKGLSLARKVGMISYRTDLNYNARFKNERVSEQQTVFASENIFQVESYLNHHGKKLTQRFDANTFLTLSHAMDFHDLARGRDSLDSVLGKISCPTLSIGIDSDLLYPAHEQQSIARAIPKCAYKEITSQAGHDAFLIEFEQMDTFIRPFLNTISDKDF